MLVIDYAVLRLESSFHGIIKAGIKNFIRLGEIILIRLKDLSKTYPDGTEAVKEISLEIETGEFCVFVGPSGCGKTTTLRMINRLIEPTSGEISIDGKSVFDLSAPELRRSIGYSIQETALFPHMTVGENIGIVPDLKKWPKKKKEERVNELLELMGMDPKVYMNRYPHELSGGQQQRIGVARAMGSDPSIMLMDEPFGGVDPITRSRLQDEFLDIQREVQKTVIFVTHDINEALKMGDKIVIMNKGEIAQTGRPQELLSDPSSSFVEDFLGADRNIKRMQLIHVEDVMKEDIPVANMEEEGESVLEKLKNYPEPFVVLVDGQGQLKGYANKREIREKKPKKVKDIMKSMSDEVDGKATLMDVFLRLFSSEDPFLPVIDRNRNLKGILTSKEMRKIMEEIFESDDNEGSENNA